MMTRDAVGLWNSLRVNLVSSVETRTKTDMKIASRVSNTSSGHTVEVETEGRKQTIAIAPKSVGRGSSINEGELLFAAPFCAYSFEQASSASVFSIAMVLAWSGKPYT